MRIILTGKRFQFVFLGTSKLHLLDTRHPYGPASIGYTMCGSQHDEADVLANSDAAEAHVCGRCLRALRTYRTTEVAFQEA